MWEAVGSWPTLEAFQKASPSALTRLLEKHHVRRISDRVESMIASSRAAVPLTDDTAVVDPTAQYAQALCVLLEQIDQQIASFDRAIDQAWADHPDRALFDSLPGAGATLAPRLAAFFGTDRTRYRNASEVQCYTGIAPVTEASGNRRLVHARWQFPAFDHQTFHEFAASSVAQCGWAKAMYRQRRSRGASRHVAIRAIAHRWIRILFRLWQTQTLYDDAHHIATLRRRGSPIADLLAA
jgi:hypothetical protein